MPTAIRDMRAHPNLKTRVSTLPTFYQGQASTGAPDEYLDIHKCRELKAQGRGDFINRGKAFRRHDVFKPHDERTYKSSKRLRGESLRIDDPGFGDGMGMMSRFVAGDPIAIAAVNSWDKNHYAFLKSL